MGVLHKNRNNFIVIPRYDFKIPKEHARFDKAVTDLFERIRDAKTAHDLKLSHAQRLEVLQKTISLTRTNVFHSVEDYMNKRHGVYDYLLSTVVDDITVDKDQIRVIDDNFKFFEVANTNGHCAYLSTG